MRIYAEEGLYWQLAHRIGKFCMLYIRSNALETYQYYKCSIYCSKAKIKSEIKNLPKNMKIKLKIVQNIKE